MEDNEKNNSTETSNSLNEVDVELSVMLGQTFMPVHQLLRMGRGAVIDLDPSEDGEVVILANNQPIAKGDILIQSGCIAVSVTEMLKRGKLEHDLI
ncbi:MAG: FliM/FliN family flagellar motor switch protein [Alphaproteobacteria bacterium]|nr:FliM/FliN family flagellar motor switch protein [Alphaproteobacteria bacterium]